MGVAAAPPVLDEVRWVEARALEREEQAALVEADGGVAWKVRCRGDAPPRRTWLRDGLAVHGTFSDPEPGPGGAWTFAPAALGSTDTWRVEGAGCRVWTRDSQPISRGFDRLQWRTPAEDWAPSLPASDLDRYRVLRPPLLWGPGLATVRPEAPADRLGDGWWEGRVWHLPAGHRVLVRVEAEEPVVCLALDGRPSCAPTGRDGAATWWIGAPHGGATLSAAAPLRARVVASRSPAGPVAEPVIWPACEQPDGCAREWDALDPEESHASTTFLVPPGDAPGSWVRVEAAAETTWLDAAGRARVVALKPGPDCVLAFGTDRYRAWVPPGTPVLASRFVVGGGTPPPPRAEGCEVWLGLEGPAPAGLDSRTMLGATVVASGRPARWTLDPAREAALWVGREQPGPISIDLHRGDAVARWTVEVGAEAAARTDTGGRTWVGPVRIPIAAGTGAVTVEADGAALARVLQPATGDEPVAPPPPEAHVSGLEALSTALAEAPDATARASVLRARAAVLAGLGLDDAALDDLRLAAALDPAGVTEGEADPWPHLARTLLGEGRAMPTGASWLRADPAPPPPREQDALLALARPDLDGAERIRLWRRAIVDGQVLTGEQRVLAYLDLVRHGPPELLEDPLTVVIRMLSRWERVHGIRDTASASRAVPPDPEATEQARLQDALFPERWALDRTADVPIGGRVLWPAGGAAEVGVRCRRVRDPGPCAVEVRDAGTDALLERRDLDGWGRAATLALPASEHDRTLVVTPSRGTRAQVLLPAAPEAPVRRVWRALPDTPLRVDVVGPTALRIRTEAGEPAAVQVRAEDGPLAGRDGIWVLPAAGPQAVWIRPQAEQWLVVDLRVPRPGGLAGDAVAAADGAQEADGLVVAAPALRARPAGRPPVTLEAGSMLGADPAWRTESAALLRSRPGEAPLWLAIGGEQSAVTAGVLEADWVPLWGRERLVLAGRMLVGPTHSSGSVTVRGGRWVGPWLLRGELSAFARRPDEDHPRGLRASVGGRFAPVQRFDVRAEAFARSNPTLDALDTVGASLSVDGARGPLWGRLGARVSRAASTRTTLFARGWAFGWMRGVLGVQWRVEGAVRVGGAPEWSVGTGPVLWLSADRGLRDVPPSALAHREAALFGWDRSADRAFVEER